MGKLIKEIRREILPDLDADLSWLDQTDKEMGDGFEARSAERKSTYGESWSMVGVRACAEVEINGTTQTITSAGLWGIEDDSDASHFDEVYQEECAALTALLIELGFAVEEIQAAL